MPDSTFFVDGNEKVPIDAAFLRNVAGLRLHPNYSHPEFTVSLGGDEAEAILYALYMAKVDNSRGELLAGDPTKLFQTIIAPFKLADSGVITFAPEKAEELLTKRMGPVLYEYAADNEQYCAVINDMVISTGVLEVPGRTAVCFAAATPSCKVNEVHESWCQLIKLFMDTLCWRYRKQQALAAQGNKEFLIPLRPRVPQHNKGRPARASPKPDEILHYRTPALATPGVDPSKVQKAKPAQPGRKRGGPSASSWTDEEDRTLIRAYFRKDLPSDDEIKDEFFPNRAKSAVTNRRLALSREGHRHPFFSEMMSKHHK